MPAPELTATTPLDDELVAERAHLATSRAALRRMRERAESLFATGDKVAGDAYTAEQLGRHMARRVKELADDPTTPLFFGRLDFGGHADSPPSGETDPDHAGRNYHVGRRHVTDDLGEPLVLDWRAPVSRSFYRASARDPQGVAVRRRFGFSAGVLTSFEDEHLDRGEELGTASRILTAEIERPRVGPMRDIVATIQPEQDELVRADLADSICVQGAPGTGKTAVGLHRAAYLLYLHRERLRRSGVLIVGPNRAFLSYIAAVLPALGEVEVEQATVEDLVARVPVRAVDDPAAAALKHDIRMAEVLRRAVEAHIGTPTEPIMVSDGSYRWRIGLDPLHRLVTETRQEGLPYATGRDRVRARVVGLLQRQAEARRAESPSDAWLRRMSRIKPVTDLLDAVWPALTPDGLLHRLRTDAEALAAAADGLLSADEQELFRAGKVGRTARATRWTAADAVLLDEVAGLLERPAGFRSRGGRRGAGPLADAVPGHRPPQRTRLDHAPRRPGPGHRALGRDRLAGVPGPPGQAGRRGGAAERRLPGAGRRGRVREPAAARARRRRTPGPVAAPRRGARCAYRRGPDGRDGGRGAGGAGARRLGRRDRRRRHGGPAPRGARRRRRRDRDRRRRRGRERASPSSRRRLSRAWSTTTWWSSNRPRSWPPSRAACTASTWC